MFTVGSATSEAIEKSKAPSATSSEAAPVAREAGTGDFDGLEEPENKRVRLAAQEASTLPDLHTMGCCAGIEDGRAALCETSTRQHASMAGSPDGGFSGEASGEARVGYEDDADEWQGLLDQYGRSANLDAPQRPPCPLASFDLASSAAGVPTTALFINRAPFPVRVLHLDGDGIEVPILSLSVDEHAEVTGLSSHAWRVRTQGGALLVERAATQAPEDAIQIRECAEK